MGVLTAYHGVVEEEGIVRLRQAPSLPAGTEVVVVVAQSLPSLSGVLKALKKRCVSANDRSLKPWVSARWASPGREMLS